MRTVLKVFRLPDLGEGLTESEIVNWKVAVGQTVALNQVIAEVETAKAVVELPSPFAGVVTKLHEEPGTVVEVGNPIVSFEVPDADGGGSDDGGFAQPDAATATGDPGGDDGAPAKREPTLVGYGAAVETRGRPVRRQRAGTLAYADQGMPSTETTRPAAPAPADVDGPVGRQAGAFDANMVGRGSAAASPTDDGGSAGGHPAERPRSTPPVRKYARDLGVDLEGIVGTGPYGLITREDVQAASSTASSDSSAGSSSAASTTPASAGTASSTPAGTGAGTAAGAAAPSSAGSVEMHAGAQPTGTAGQPAAMRTLGRAPREVRIPIRGVRKYTAAAMVASAFTAPHATEFLTIDVTPTMELLTRLKSRREFDGVKLTPLTIVAKAVCIALERTPSLNSRWDEAAGEIVQLNYINLGIAAATPRGLTVPNIKDAQALDLPGLGAALAELATSARAGKTAQADLTGGTISITNVGVFGVDAGTPILNPGEAGILAVGQVRRMPWEYRDEIALRQVMTLSLSFDHRLVDGEQGSRFLADVGTILADPGMLIAMV